MTPHEALVALTASLAGASLTIPVHQDQTKQAAPADYPIGWIELVYQCGREGSDGSSTFGVDKSYYRSRDALTATAHTPRTRGVGAAWLAIDALRAHLLELSLGELYVESVLPGQPEELDPEDTHATVALTAIVIREAFFP